MGVTDGKMTWDELAQKVGTLQAEVKRLREERDEARAIVERIVQAHPDFEKQIEEYRQALEGSE